ncbi:Disintegrin and metalloproteinase domain-containing protein 12-like protein [Leptotrombidium deliense]|uniref:Disintegrin and metalloproteinase domain-containing protein 12-like protein n=1 Tax=Leptotrombidium deliense TaxID=299467 RepID=A0A443S0U7_9ACAR|nr:Disintegrin and metalloproteinase domain-containing protein 12-like protein [Leptotrombidium deliense]
MDDSFGVANSECYKLNKLLNITRITLRLCDARMYGIFEHVDKFYSIEYDSQEKKHFIDISPQIDCGSNVTEEHINGEGMLLAKLRNLYLPVSVVVDYGLYLANNKNVNHIENGVKELIRMVAELFKPLNVFVTLVELEIWDEKYLFNVPDLSNQLLEAFRKYRKNKRMKSLWNCHRNAVFLTYTFLKNEYNSQIRGTAYQDNLCKNKLELSVSVVSTKYLNMDGIAQVIAHEIGHNLGMQHDNKSCNCSSGANRCIMKPGDDGYFSNDWSSCSIEGLLYHQRQGDNDCLFEEFSGCTQKIPTEIIIAIITVVVLIAVFVFVIVFCVLKRYYKAGDTLAKS